MRKSICFIPIFIFLCTGMAVADISRPPKESPVVSPALEKEIQAIKASYAKLPLSFVKNEGQKDKTILFYEQGSGHATAFTREGVSLGLAKSGKVKAPRSELVTLTPLNPSAFTIEALDKKEGKVNYFMGSDPSKWKTDISTYGAILYRGIYPGIDMKFYGTNSQIEYDIIVAPGADPSRVRLSYKGAEKLTVTQQGELEIALRSGSIFQKKPFIYQTAGEKKTEIKGKFVLLDTTTYGFEVGPYDRNIPLVIDPTLVYSTYLGGNDDDETYGLAIDSSGSVYVAGETYSTDFPTVNAYQGSKAGGTDVFILKFSSSGATLIYSTYLGGSSADYARALAVDSSGNAYVTGYTTSNNFPTVNAFQASRGGGDDAFVTKLGPTGNTLVYSTYLGRGGSDSGYAIAVDFLNNAYVTGTTNSTDFYTTVNAYQGSNAGGYDAFVTKFSSSGAELEYSTYLGGASGNDYGQAIAVDSLRNAYVAGYTYSTNFPTANAYQGSNAGYSDAFIAKLDSLGSSLAYSTYLGGTDYDRAYGLAIDSSGNAYVAGYTYSTNFPTVNAYQGAKAGGNDGFIAKLGSSGSTLVYSTYLGGTGEDYVHGLAIDSSGNAYAAGHTNSTNFPTVNAYQGSNAGGNDGFIAKLGSSGSTLVYSTYLGGVTNDTAQAIAVSSLGNVHVAGHTDSVDFPVLNAYQGSQAGPYGTNDAFIIKVAGDTDVYTYFSGDGLYKYESSWTMLTRSQPQTMVAAGSTMYISFAGDGLYKYDGSWTKITTGQPQTMVAAGSTMYVYFTGDGLYKYDGSWTRITTGQPQTMVAGGSNIYPCFSGDGLYKYDGATWTLLTRTAPASLVGSSDGFYAYFTSDGLYKYNGSWTKITSGQPASMTVSGTTLYPYFSGDGLYRYDGSWTLLTRTQPASIIASGDGFYACFTSDGLYKYNGAWARITSGQPSMMVVSGSVLYPYFTGDGLYRYDGSWTLLTRSQPASMTGLGAN